ncbi:outer membrane protein [Aquicoccus sp. G2-2]|uniref:outer membrane protein n=1 Tax=Aquicoccus sp. G2-2 TaxID=3092120 RepID=UPI002ADFA458|nr:outer membrane beta-barrel protein [Aquicoccus sp. G2-2]MEA1114849.1 outer membrane beta-barrel protein [Aquicoccus sp. G2-2]
MTFRKFTFAAATTAATALAAPAFAGSPAPAPVDTPVAVPVAPLPVSGDWTGFYGGLSLGYGSADLSGGGGNDSGAVYGLSAGYDYDMGNWVVGAGIDYDWANLNPGGTSIDNFARLKLRAGYDLGQGLAYATAGGERAYTSLGDDTGWVAGLGYEQKITDHLSLGGEVLYHKYEDFNGSGVNVDGTSIAIKTNYRF